MTSKISIVALGDICDVRDGTHDSPKPKVDGHPLVTSKHIKNGTIDFTSANLISGEDFVAVNRRSKVDQFDVLISMIGTVGELVFVDIEPEYAIKNIGLIKTGGDEMLGRYIYYYLKSPKAKNHLHASLVGSTQKFIGLGELRKFPISLLDLKSRTTIVTTLSNLDRKIELNRQMNATLEQIGQTLFKKYFVDNPESEEWENVQLGNYVELVNGATYKSSELSESDCALLTLKNFKRKGGFKREGYKQFTGKFKDEQVVQDGDLVAAHTDLTQQAEVAGVPALVSGADDFQTVGISMDVVKIIPKEELINSGFLYFLMMSHEFQSYKMGYITGSTVLHLNKKCIPNFTFKLPDEKTLQTLSPVFKEIIFKMTLNDSEIDSLEKTRDSVLPKLMSGEIKV
jgi:type I restriction enzyme S subunit